MRRSGAYGPQGRGNRGRGDAAWLPSPTCCTTCQENGRQQIRHRPERRPDQGQGRGRPVPAAEGGSGPPSGSVSRVALPACCVFSPLFLQSPALVKKDRSRICGCRGIAQVVSQPRFRHRPRLCHALLALSSGKNCGTREGWGEYTDAATRWSASYRGPPFPSAVRGNQPLQSDLSH